MAAELGMTAGGGYISDALCLLRSCPGRQTLCNNQANTHTTAKCDRREGKVKGMLKDRRGATARKGFSEKKATLNSAWRLSLGKPVKEGKEAAVFAKA